MTRFCISLSFVSLLALAGSPVGVHRVSLTVLDDETGKPLPGMEAGASFCNKIMFDFNRPTWITRTAETDEDGKCSIAGVCTRGEIRVGVNGTETYYGMSEDVEVNPLEMFVSRTFRLRRRRPVTLQRGRCSLSEEFTNSCSISSRYRFDFLRRSFLPPYGTGTVADIEFRIDELGQPLSENALYHHKYVIAFPGAGNGGVLREINRHTDFRIDRVCEHEMTNKFLMSACEGRLLGFRIRTQVDDSGQLTNAYYGYIEDATSPMHLFHHVKAANRSDVHCNRMEVRFAYLINPVPCENKLESANGLQTGKCEHFRFPLFPQNSKEDR